MFQRKEKIIQLMRGTMTVMAVAIPFIPIGDAVSTDFVPLKIDWKPTYLHDDHIAFRAYLFFSCFALFYIWLRPKHGLIKFFAILLSCAMLFFCQLYLYPHEDFSAGYGIVLLFMWFIMFLVYIFLHSKPQEKTTDILDYSEIPD
jgi:hypothetical protein